MAKNCGEKNSSMRRPSSIDFGRQRNPGESEAVRQAQAEMRPMHDVSVAIEDMRPIVVGFVVIESEELLLDGDLGIRRARDRREQVESAAKLLVKNGAGQIVAGRRAAIEKEPAAKALIRFVDRDVLARNVGVPDEQGRRRQPAKPAANNVRLHLFLPRLKVARIGVACGKAAPIPPASQDRKNAHNRR